MNHRGAISFYRQRALIKAPAIARASPTNVPFVGSSPNLNQKVVAAASKLVAAKVRWTTHALPNQSFKAMLEIAQTIPFGKAITKPSNSDQKTKKVNRFGNVYPKNVFVLASSKPV